MLALHLASLTTASIRHVLDDCKASRAALGLVTCPVTTSVAYGCLTTLCAARTALPMLLNVYRLTIQTAAIGLQGRQSESTGELF